MILELLIEFVFDMLSYIFVGIPRVISGAPVYSWILNQIRPVVDVEVLNRVVSVVVSVVSVTEAIKITMYIVEFVRGK